MRETYSDFWASSNKRNLLFTDPSPTELPPPDLASIRRDFLEDTEPFLDVSLYETVDDATEDDLCTTGMLAAM